MYLVAREFDLVLNIRLAKIDHMVGEATIELEGKPEDLEKAVKKFQSRGVKVESVLGDIVAG